MNSFVNFYYGYLLKSHHEAYMMKTRKLQSCKLRVAGYVLFNCLIINVPYYMHDVTPKVVAIAVRIVMAIWMIFCQISCLFMILIYDF